MKNPPPQGHTSHLARRVEIPDSIELGDQLRLRVFSTPAMIDMMEHAARAGLVPFLDEGEESVGIDVQVNHSAATRVGAKVRATAVVTGIENNIVDFGIEAFDERGPIGRGSHRRAIVRTTKLIEKISEEAPAAEAVDTPKPETSTLHLLQNGPLLRIALARPSKKNAINRQMTTELQAVSHWLARQSTNIRVVIIEGEGGNFSAGDDLGDIAAASLAEAHQLSVSREALYTSWARLPQVMIAQVDGLALGGGCICAASCDFRFASHNARFGMPELHLGWLPNYGVARLLALLGPSRAMELVCVGQQISATSARELQLIHDVVPNASLAEHCEQFAGNLLQMPPAALREAKQLLASPAAVTAEQSAAAFVRCLKTPNAREGMQAFQDKRPPNFVF